MRHLYHVIGATVIVFTLAATGAADEVVLTGPSQSEDTMIRRNSPDENHDGAWHEYTHLVIRPDEDDTWDGAEHLRGNPGGNALMGDATVFANSREATVEIKAETQEEIDLKNNPHLR